MVQGLFLSGASDEAPHGARPVRVLVVDDNRDQVLTLVAILRDEGYDTKGAYSGKEALAAIKEFDPDAMIADLAMPGMSGWDLAREVRSTGYENRPFMIAISGEYRANADKVLSHMVGFDHYLVKPCSPDEVLALLRPLRLPS